MSIMKTIMEANTYDSLPIIILRLENMIIASGVKEFPDNDQILLINPMIINTGVKENGQEFISLKPYIPVKLIASLNSFIAKSKILSYHQPSMMMIEFYAKKTMETIEIHENEEEPHIGIGPRKEKKQSTSNSNTIISMTDWKKNKGNTVLVTGKESPEDDEPPTAA